MIFDLDGVLVMSEPPLAEAAVALFADKGHTVNADDFKPFIGMGEDRYIGGVAEIRGIKLDVDRDKARLYEIYARVIRGRLQPLPGAIAFVNACRDQGLAVAVASGADRIKVAANLREIKDRSQIPPALFAFLEPHVRRLAMFTVRRNRCVGWEMHGPGVAPQPLAALAFRRERTGSRWPPTCARSACPRAFSTRWWTATRSSA